MIDLSALLTAVRARLVNDPTLSPLVEGVFAVVIPPTVTWTKPVIEAGIQAEARDLDASGYGADASDMRLRLMVHARGAAPGVGDFAASYAALMAADAALAGTPLVVAGQHVYELRRWSSVPATAVPDDQGYMRMSIGALFRVRSEVA